MSVPVTTLSLAIREHAEKHAESDRPYDADTRELLLILARIVEGKGLAKAFGAPGDFGYSHPIGKGIFEALKKGEFPS